MSDRSDELFGPRPPIARRHCRHYEVLPGLREGGYICKVGAMGTTTSESGYTYADTAPCMPDPKKACHAREEWTDEERAAWEAYQSARDLRLIKGIAAIPEPIPLRSEGGTECPNCGGRLSWSRAGNGHVWLQCVTTKRCLGPVHFNIARETAWPASAAERAKNAQS